MRPLPQHVRFVGSAGSTLAGRLDLPAGPPRAYALFAHCFTCSKDLVASGRIAAELNAHGIAVLRFDFTGLGSSEGEFANTDFSSNLADLRHAADWLRTHHRPPQLLIGHSLGGAAVIAVAGDIPEVRAVATIGAPADVAHIVRLFDRDAPTIERDGRTVVRIGGRSFTIRQELIDDLAAHSVEASVSTMRAAILVLHAPGDNAVAIENAARLFGAARHPKSFVALDGADHLLTNSNDARYAASIIGCWANRFLIDEHPSAAPPASSAPVVVAETGQGMFLNHVVVGEHRLMADEPIDVGGFDAGPSPYELLGAALGACTSMTLRMYAEKKGLSLGRIAVEVRHDKVHASDCDQCVSGGGPLIDHFERRISFDPAPSADHREALARIADRCPVHRTLEAASHITTIVDGA